jgi:hypothetical protein
MSDIDGDSSPDYGLGLQFSVSSRRRLKQSDIERGQVLRPSNAALTLRATSLAPTHRFLYPTNAALTVTRF